MIDLLNLWQVVGGCAEVRICAELRWGRGHTAGTRLAQGSMAADEIVQHLRKTFELARYYNELTHNIDLWQFTLAAYRVASLGLVHAVRGMALVAGDVSWEDVIAFNRCIGRGIVCDSGHKPPNSASFRARRRSGTLLRRS